MDKNTIINQLRNMSAKMTDNLNEENVKHHIVIRMLHIFGYSDDLELEFSQGSDRPDIIIRSFEQPIVVEVKGSNHAIDDHIDQIRRYSYSFDAFLSIITNGDNWYFFSPFWKRGLFARRLIFAFKRKDLGDRRVVETLISLLSKELGFKQLAANILELENQIINQEAEVKVVEERIAKLGVERAAIEEKYPNLSQLHEVMPHLDSDVRADLLRHSELKTEIDKTQGALINQNKEMPQVHGHNQRTSEAIQERHLSTRSYSPPRHRRTGSSDGEDFGMGIADEVINIKALQNGTQICLCKTHKKSNNHIFLVPKRSYDSEFEPSEIGVRLSVNEPTKDCQHIAVIDYLPIPGLNRDFWQAMYDAGEFELWVIDQGPLKYFQRSSRRKKMLLWLLRVYKMPFLMREDVDFIRHGQGNLSMSNMDTLQRIQEGFAKGAFVPVVEDGQYKQRRQAIASLARRFQ